MCLTRALAITKLKESDVCKYAKLNTLHQVMSLKHLSHLVRDMCVCVCMWMITMESRYMIAYVNSRTAEKKKSKRNYIMNQFTAHHTYTEKERKSVRTVKNEWILRSCIKFDKHNQMKSSTYHTQKLCKDFICFSTVSNFYISLLCFFSNVVLPMLYYATRASPCHPYTFYTSNMSARHK